jgi:hypothetical protein
MADDASVDRATTNSLKAVGTIKALLTEMDMSPTEQTLPAGIAFHVALEGPADQAIAQVLTDAERFVFHFVFPGYVESARRLKVAEFIARANWALIEGTFEVYLETGPVRERSSPRTPMTSTLRRPQQAAVSSSTAPTRRSKSRPDATPWASSPTCSCAR